MTPLSNQDKIDFFYHFGNEIVVLPLAYGNNGYRLSTEIFISFYQSSRTTFYQRARHFIRTREVPKKGVRRWSPSTVSEVMVPT